MGGSAHAGRRGGILADWRRFLGGGPGDGNGREEPGSTRPGRGQKGSRGERERCAPVRSCGECAPWYAVGVGDMVRSRPPPARSNLKRGKTVKAFILAGAFLFAFSFSAVTADAESSIKKSGWFGSVGVGLLSPDLPDGDFEFLIPDDFSFTNEPFSIGGDIPDPDVGSGPISRLSIGYNSALSYGSFQVEGEFGFGGNDFSGSDYSLQSYGINLRYVFATIDGIVFPFVGAGGGQGRSELKLGPPDGELQCQSVTVTHVETGQEFSGCLPSGISPGQPFNPNDLLSLDDANIRRYEYKADEGYFSGSAGLIISPKTVPFRAVIEYRYYDLSDDLSANTGSITLQWPF